MKIAIVHDWLNVKIGGAERVFFELARIYPQADLYALVCDYPKFAPYLGGRQVKTSYLQHFPAIIRQRPKLLLPFVRRAVEAFDFSDYDLVISDSTAWVKNIKVGPKTKHLCYCHSPARMMWDSWPSYLDGQTIGPFRLGPISRFWVTRLISKLRIWDFYGSDGVDMFVANSQFVAKRIKKYYRREANVIYPPVDVHMFESTYRPEKQDYYLVLSVLSRYKQLDMVIAAFKESGRKLIIAGTGPDEMRLRDLARNAHNIVFRGRVSDQEKIRLLKGAKAFIFPSIEDFGITPVEAMVAGTPVIALRGGGLIETIPVPQAGVFFDEPTVESLNAAIEHAHTQKFDPAFGHKAAEAFSVQRFSEQIISAVDQVSKQAKYQGKYVKTK